MSNTYVANNGLKIERKGGRTILTDGGSNMLEGFDFLSERDMGALREKILFDMGVWTDPGTGALVIPTTSGGLESKHVSVYVGGVMHSFSLTRDERAPRDGAVERIARRYFAHFDPTTDTSRAVTGEAWLLTITSEEGEPKSAPFFVDHTGCFVGAPDRIVTLHVNHPSIVSGRRIYPEASK